MSVTGSWFVPKDLAARKAQKVDTEIEYTLTLLLKNDSKRVDMKLSLNNQALDHRMRLVVKTPVKSQVSYADTLFGIVERNNHDPHIHDWRELGWKEEPTEIYPMIHYANTHDLETSWTVMSKGIKEYQVIDSDMYITLFRGVGFLGRPELLRRPGDASGNQFRYIPTPDSQLLGTLEMELSLIIATDYNPADIQREYQMYSVDTPYYQVQTLNRFTNPIQYFQSNKVDHLTTLKKSIDLSELPLVFSAIELSRDGEWINIRLYNPLLEETVKAEIILLATQAHVRFVNLNGDLITSLGLINEIPLGDFKPGQIKTISIKR